MGGVSLTGKDTQQIGTAGATLRVLKDLADGDCGNLDFPNNMVEVKKGKNGNTIYAINASGDVCTYTVRVLRGSADDKYFNAQMALYKKDPAAYVLLDGEFVKRAGDGLGNVTNDVYRVSGGIIQKMPNAKENVDGDTEQAVTVWQLIFGQTDRSLT